MSGNSIWGAVIATIIGGLFVEMCKPSIQAALNSPDAPNVVLPTAAQTSVVNELVTERVPQGSASRHDDSAPEPIADVPSAEAPAVETPQPAPEPSPVEPSPPAYGSIGGGTTFRVIASERVCTHTHRHGATFTGELAQYVGGSDGVGISPGATVRFAVQARGVGESGGWTIQPITLSTGGEAYPLQASASNYAVRSVSRGRDRALGGVVGAVIGLAGAKAAGANDKEAAAAAAVGGAAGAVAASGTQACLNDAGVIDVTLDAPLLLPAH